MYRQLFSDTGNTNKIITLPEVMQYLEIVNRSASDLTIIVNGMVTKVTPKDYTFEGGYNNIKEIEIVANGEWEIKVGY